MYLRHFQVQVDVLEMENVLKWADHLFDQHILVKDFDYTWRPPFSVASVKQGQAQPIDVPIVNSIPHEWNYHLKIPTIGGLKLYYDVHFVAYLWLFLHKFGVFRKITANFALFTWLYRSQFLFNFGRFIEINEISYLNMWNMGDLMSFHWKKHSIRAYSLK